MAYNGGCVVAMKGKDCVAIATDHRFGIQVNLEKFAKSSNIRN
jgi:20S proteasome alpha/beta subunit